ncbi:hypothetical protein MTAT_26730 [Moorella thermoacetica]|uniref:Uncharacterized protein n=1 Tax=Neomoorella thermoacetica TaxID=1525 RepID=A0AAC9HG38_NEOTH|nr:hypothetical protein [Moorella thermoacetica]AOQ23028.1 hypothetical protein Maut_00561 [Moorella thermoacetica]TYL09005.1 hypothetical protein MTAT_26730 [Moorella thermoacetica]
MFPLVKAELSYSDLADIIYRLSGAACRHFGIDDLDDLPLGKFVEFLEAMPENARVHLIAR